MSMRMNKRKQDFPVRNLGTKKFRRIPKKAGSIALIKRVLDGQMETKYLDVASNGVDMTQNVGATACFNQIPAGDEFNTRDGRKARIKYIYYDLTVRLSNALATTVDSFVATIHLVLDRQSNGAAAGFSTVFDTTVVSPTTAFKNVETYEKRFRILKTLTFVIGSNAAGQPYRFRGTIPFESAPDMDQVMEFGTSGAAVPTRNALLLCYASNETAANDVFMDYALRTVFTDM